MTHLPLRTTQRYSIATSHEKTFHLTVTTAGRQGNLSISDTDGSYAVVYERHHGCQPPHIKVDTHLCRAEHEDFLRACVSIAVGHGRAQPNEAWHVDSNHERAQTYIDCGISRSGGFVVIDDVTGTVERFTVRGRTKESMPPLTEPSAPPLTLFVIKEQNHALDSPPSECVADCVGAAASPFTVLHRLVQRELLTSASCTSLVGAWVWTGTEVTGVSVARGAMRCIAAPRFEYRLSSACTPCQRC